jgi:uncharacterized protein (DUF302 family)
MSVKQDYGIRKTIDLPYADAVVRIKEALKTEGFGILSEIDIREKLREKLGVDFQPYVILGACNPPLAHRALQADKEMGLLLPCNVIVYSAGPSRSVVSAIDPDTMAAVAGDNPVIAEVAADARARLERAIKSL